MKIVAIIALTMMATNACACDALVVNTDLNETTAYTCYASNSVVIPEAIHREYTAPTSVLVIKKAAKPKPVRSHRHCWHHRRHLICSL